MVHRRTVVAGLVGLGAVGGAGCTARGQPVDLTDVEEWPPESTDDVLEFWTWEPYWRHQARAFEHVADLETLESETVPEQEQYRRLADGTSPDVLHFTSKQFDRAVENDLLAPLPVDTLPSWPIDEDLRVHDLDFYERDGEYYGVPQTPLAYALAYNRDTQDEPSSLSLLWDESLEGRLSMPAEPVLTGQVAALYTGQDPNDPDDIEAIRDALATQQPLVEHYWDDWHECWTMFETGGLEAAILPYTPMCLCDHDESPVRRVAPEEGVMYSIVTFAIPRDAAHPHTGLEFLDWGVDFKTGSELTWDADEWTLHHATALEDEVRDAYHDIADDLGIVAGSA